jgi:hypothetical protein
VVFLAVKVWETIEPDHAIRNAAFAESVADSLRYSNNNLALS